MGLISGHSEKRTYFIIVFLFCPDKKRHFSLSEMALAKQRSDNFG